MRAGAEPTEVEPPVVAAPASAPQEPPGEDQGPAGEVAVATSAPDDIEGGPHEAPQDQEPGGGDEQPQGDEGPEAQTPAFKIMAVIDVRVDLPDSYAVVSMIEDEPPGRHLEIPIGLPDGTALAYAVRDLETPRPLTHELFADVLRRMQIDLVAVRLTGRRRGTYLAELDLMGPRGRDVVACRPSDGMALALRQAVPAPVLADERLLEGSGDVEPL